MQRLALDAGQSGVRAMVVRGSERPRIELDLSRHRGIRTDLPVAAQLADVVRRVHADVGALDAVAIGATGFAGTEDLRDLHALSHLGVRSVSIAHDSVTSYLGALGAEQGAVVAAGTGVVTLAVGESSVARVDGWGNIMGDAGSGYWFGRAALTAALRAYDGRGPATVLLDRVRDEFGDVEDAYLQLQADPGHIRRTASFSRWVTDAEADGDAVAAEICRCGAAELALAVAAGLARVGADTDSASAVCAIGGLFQSDAITRAFVGELHQRRPFFRSTVPRGDGLTGAEELLALPAEHPLTSRVTTLTLA
ncbi:BadF/BadG/BcrA/BcrD ATPase family protein [Rathayibacter sp. VKM Ac-2927]|uniref:BadF/BadG/BcrA/BcrD ATPase family protein n=1 Tax=Rathayibacter sp. VKM Ac-2927 TaxID=2929478 RepID=UPI001FB4685A|nr:BadF/BadG/BcrA/BcrD ATPase family protein [Rathayibacter sp. VKM Ac-2927]MCJ1687026.1 hypothetical protein [Rathayibacter sp. VKM Ac-2927]